MPLTTVYLPVVATAQSVVTVVDYNRATANATLAVMGGRTMQGWLRVSSEDLETGEQLTEWVNRAVGYARSLPPKR